MPRLFPMNWGKWIGYFLMMQIVSFAAELQPKRQDLEAIYNRYHTAWLKQDANEYLDIQPTYQIAQMQNIYASLKKKFPEEVFKGQYTPPAIENLEFLGAKTKSDKAVLTYIGDVQFGSSGTKSKNIVILSFVKEKSAWKFLKVTVQLGDEYKKIEAKLAAKDLSFLDAAPYAPDDSPTPDIPPLISAPDYVAYYSMTTPHEGVKIEVNSFSATTTSEGTSSSGLVIGGLKRGDNKIKLTVPNEATAQSYPFYEFRIWTINAEEKRVCVWEYKPQKLTAVYEAMITLSDEKIASLTPDK